MCAGVSGLGNSSVTDAFGCAGERPCATTRSEISRTVHCTRAPSGAFAMLAEHSISPPSGISTHGGAGSAVTREGEMVRFVISAPGARCSKPLVKPTVRPAAFRGSVSTKQGCAELRTYLGPSASCSSSITTRPRSSCMRTSTEAASPTPVVICRPAATNAALAAIARQRSVAPSRPSIASSRGTSAE